MITLSNREIQVIDYAADGLTNAEIGAKLGLSEETIRTHCRRIFAKLGARNRAHAAVIALREGVIR